MLRDPHALRRRQRCRTRRPTDQSAPSAERGRVWILAGTVFLVWLVSAT
jgi:hypothetical protein